MSFTGVVAEIWVRDYTQVRGDSKTAASPKSTPVWVICHKSWKPGVHCVAYRQLLGLEGVLSKPLPGSSDLLGVSLRSLFSLYMIIDRAAY